MINENATTDSLILKIGRGIVIYWMFPIFILSLPICLGLLIYQFNNTINASDWNKTKARIIKTQIQQNIGHKFRTKYTLDVIYEYQINEKTYHSKSYRPLALFSSEKFTSETSAHKAAQEYHQSPDIIVYCNPDNPKKVYRSIDVFWYEYIAFLWLVFLFICVYSWLFKHFFKKIAKKQQYELH